MHGNCSWQPFKCSLDICHRRKFSDYHWSLREQRRQKPRQIRLAIRQSEYPSVPLPTPGRIDIKHVHPQCPIHETPGIIIDHLYIARTQHSEVMSRHLAIPRKTLHIYHLPDFPGKEIAVDTQPSCQIAQTSVRTYQTLFIQSRQLGRALLRGNLRREYEPIVLVPSRQFLLDLPTCLDLIDSERHIDSRIPGSGKQ